MTSDKIGETGIVVVGLSANGHACVLEDCSISGDPAAWGGAAVAAYHRHQADRIAGEVNNGGEMVGYVVTTLDPRVNFQPVWASRGQGHPGRACIRALRPRPGRVPPGVDKPAQRGRRHRQRRHQVSAPHATPIVDGYMARLEVALLGAPPIRRAELMEDVRAHIADARAALEHETDDALLSALDRLGEPADIAREAIERGTPSRREHAGAGSSSPECS